MNQELLMAGAMLAASVSIYAAGRWLLPKPIKVTARWQPVRRSAAREAALSAGSSFESRSPDGDGQGAASREAANRLTPAGSTPAGSLTTLGPCSRSTNGYALNFSQKNRKAFPRNRMPVPRSPIEPTR